MAQTSVTDEHNQVTVTMATKEDISDILKFNKIENAFELPTFGCKTCQNAKVQLSVGI